MRQVAILIQPRWKSFLNSSMTGERNKKFLLFGIIGTAFWAGIFTISYRMLSYFKESEGIGDILAFKLLSMILITFFSLLIFSSILTCLSKLFLSKDLLLVHSLPVYESKIFLARWIESTIDSSWMLLVYSIPVFLVYGWVYKAGPFFYLEVLFSILPLCITASGISSLLILITVVILPASRIRTIFVFLGLAVLIVLYFIFRLSRPERLVNPETFSSVMIYLHNMSTPSSPLLPSTWAFDSLKGALTGNFSGAILNNGISWSFAFLIIFFNIGVSQIVYFKGFSKSQSALSKPLRLSRDFLSKFFRPFPGPYRAFIIKEIKTFFRDQTQWSQLFLIAALIVIYVYNYSVLPLEKTPLKLEYLQNILSFLNMGLAAFVLTAITARFTFPSISTEGYAFWIVRSGPVSMKVFMWIKFFIYLFPLLALAEILIVATNIILHVKPFMMYLSSITLFCMTPGIVAMGIGFGAAYPDFTSENPAQTVTSFGGLLFMIFSAAFIGAVVMLEAGPVYTIFMSEFRGTTLSGFQMVWLVGSFILAFFLCIISVWLPMWFGEKRLRTK